MPGPWRCYLSGLHGRVMALALPVVSGSAWRPLAAQLAAAAAADALLHGTADVLLTVLLLHCCRRSAPSCASSRRQQRRWRDRGPSRQAAAARRRRPPPPPLLLCAAACACNERGAGGTGAPQRQEVVPRWLGFVDVCARVLQLQVQVHGWVHVSDGDRVFGPRGLFNLFAPVPLLMSPALSGATVFCGSCQVTKFCGCPSLPSRIVVGGVTTCAPRASAAKVKNHDFIKSP